MTNDTSLRQIVAETLSSLRGVSGSNEIETLAEQLRRLNLENVSAEERAKGNAQAPTRSTTSTSQANSALDVVNSFGRFLGISSLLTGLARLFRGGSSTEMQPDLVRFSLPAAIDAAAGLSNSAPGTPLGFDYAQGNQPRPVVTSSPQITVQVQALDSRSILDRRQDIAQAVRTAMLESGVLNDVIQEI